jgi:predicted CopG family antitoxin
MTKVKTTVSLDSEVYEKVKEIGEQEDRSFSQQVNKILKDYLKQLESK